MSQFRILYREFLFRIVDLDLIAPEGDIKQLLGRFAAFLLFLSFWAGVMGLAAAGSRLAPPLRLMAVWTAEHVLISTTMLVVGLFAVLSWNSTFPDRRFVCSSSICSPFGRRGWNATPLYAPPAMPCSRRPRFWLGDTPARSRARMRGTPFEEAPEPEVFALKIYKDGATPLLRPE